VHLILFLVQCCWWTFTQWSLCPSRFMPTLTGEVCSIRRVKGHCLSHWCGVQSSGVLRLLFLEGERGLVAWEISSFLLLFTSLPMLTKGYFVQYSSNPTKMILYEFSSILLICYIALIELFSFLKIKGIKLWQNIHNVLLRESQAEIRDTETVYQEAMFCRAGADSADSCPKAEP
jgi:hypothetical protein